MWLSFSGAEDPGELANSGLGPRRHNPISTLDPGSAT